MNKQKHIAEIKYYIEKGINPQTRRRIKINGFIYEKIKKEVDSYESIYGVVEAKKYEENETFREKIQTEEDIIADIKYFIEKGKNPRTHLKIPIGGLIYNFFKRQVDKYENINGVVKAKKYHKYENRGSYLDNFDASKYDMQKFKKDLTNNINPITNYKINPDSQLKKFLMNILIKYELKNGKIPLEKVVHLNNIEIRKPKIHIKSKAPLFEIIEFEKALQKMAGI